MKTSTNKDCLQEFQRDIRLNLLGVFIISMVINILLLSGPLYMLQVYDRVLASQSVQTLVALTILIVALYIFLAVFDSIRSAIMVRIASLFDMKVGGKVFHANALLSVEQCDEETRFFPIRDLDQCRSYLSGPGPLAILDLPWAPFYLFLLFAIHPALGLVALTAVFFLVLILWIGNWAGQGPTHDAAKHLTARNSLAAATRKSPEVTLGMGMLVNLESIWNSQTAKLIGADVKGGDRSGVLTSISKSTRMMLQSGTLGMGAYLAILGQISPGMMIAASILTARALAPLEQTISTWRNLVSARQAKCRLESALISVKDAFGEANSERPSKNLVVENLYAGPDLRTPTIKGISFRVNAGGGIGIIGPSGSGKTTLVRAILGIWPIISGSARLDGTALGQLSQEAIGRSIGFLPQDVDLFDGTIGQNIARFTPGAETDKITSAAQLAGVHDMIKSLPDGYDTLVGEGAFQLSAGQRQRLGLARALYDDPFLVVLDEPNSNLDSEGNTLLSKAILSVRSRGGIVLVIAHRPSALASIDHLLVLKDGRQESFGEKNSILGIKTGAFKSRREKLQSGVRGREKR